jgi:hypothetical protein
MDLTIFFGLKSSHVKIKFANDLFYKISLSETDGYSILVVFTIQVKQRFDKVKVIY